MRRVTHTQAVPTTHKVTTLWPDLETTEDTFETTHAMWEYVRELEAEDIPYFIMRCK